MPNVRELAARYGAGEVSPGKSKGDGATPAGWQPDPDGTGFYKIPEPVSEERNGNGSVPEGFVYEDPKDPSKGYVRKPQPVADDDEEEAEAAGPSTWELDADGTGFVLVKGAPTKVKYPHWAAFEKKCRSEGLSPTAIAAFRYNYEKLASGANLMIPEAEITPVTSLPSYDDLSATEPSLLERTVMLKLNGGLGTGMGLEKAKSLLKLKGDDTFLDFIAKQVTFHEPSMHLP